jgi:hypothetical protein
MKTYKYLVRVQAEDHDAADRVMNGLMDDGAWIECLCPLESGPYAKHDDDEDD